MNNLQPQTGATSSALASQFPQLGQSGSANGPRPSLASTEHTYLMPASPAKRPAPSGNYKPQILRTCGQRPACLVNASVTYCGNDTIFAFGGFDQWTDEVYNHVLKLDLKTLQWTLVDNYGDIPGVRMGHTACLWQGTKLLIYGGENEHREYLSDVVIYDVENSHWTQPEIRGPIPRGRARHAAAIHDDKLYISGGLAGTENANSDEVCFLDLKTWSWSRSWSFVARYDHTAWFWGGKFCVLGGLDPEMERTSDIWSLDIKNIPAFESVPSRGRSESPEARRPGTNPRSNSHINNTTTGSSGYAANSSSVQRASSYVARSTPPGAISNIKIVSGPEVPDHGTGMHFYTYSSNALLDFKTPAGMLRASEFNLSALDLATMRWQKLAAGQEIFDTSYRWHYLVLDDNGSKAWLLGCLVDLSDNASVNEEYLSDVLALDLSRYGVLGNAEASHSSTMEPSYTSNSPAGSNGQLGLDLAAMFDQKDAGCDFVVTATKDFDDDIQSSASTAVDHAGMSTNKDPAITSVPIHVHRLILQARWPHFSRLWNSEMAEFHSRKLHIPEPYAVVRAFLYYLYSDSIAWHPLYCKDLDDVAGMLVLSQVYDIPRLRLLCLHRLGRELDVEHAAIIWERAGLAQDQWLQRQAAVFCMTNWGRVVRTQGFRQLSHDSMTSLCEVIDVEGRILTSEELESIGGLGGGKIEGPLAAFRRRTFERMGTAADEDNDGPDDEGMELS